MPWFGGQYGHDLAPNERYPDWGCQFDAALTDRALGEAAELGFDAVRVWLCENGEGILTRNGLEPAGVHPTLLANLDTVQRQARARSLRVYWTLLDANAWQREGDELTHRVFSHDATAAAFGERVVAPIARALDPEVTLAFELLNEPEVLTEECLGAGYARALSWERLAGSLRVLGDAARDARAGIRVTSGTMHVFLPRLWAAGPRLDAVDVHVYHASGGLPSREDLANHAADPALRDPAFPLFAGECGMPDHLGTAAHPKLAHYVYNADRAGYDAAFLWRLDGPLVNPSGRYFTDTAAIIRDTLRARGR